MFPVFRDGVENKVSILKNSIYKLVKINKAPSEFSQILK